MHCSYKKSIWSVTRHDNRCPLNAHFSCNLGMSSTKVLFFFECILIHCDSYTYKITQKNLKFESPEFFTLVILNTFNKGDNVFRYWELQSRSKNIEGCGWFCQMLPSRMNYEYLLAYVLRKNLEIASGCFYVNSKKLRCFCIV